jgi:hypothetical protein
MSDQPPSQGKPSNPLRKFLSDQQDPAAVRQVYGKVRQILTTGEEILYIAVQKGVVNLSPDCAVLTNRRFIVYRPKLLGGASFQDYIWRDLRDARLKEGMLRASLTLHTVRGTTLTIAELPKAQARKLYAFAQEMEEKVLEERRLRAMEEKRAAAGGIVMQSGVPTAQAPSSAVSQEDPVQVLMKLKEMLDAGLITAQEYGAKKEEILSRM